MSASGSGRVCIAAFIAYCPWCQRSALPQCEVQAQGHPVTLLRLTRLAVWALTGYVVK